MATPRLKEKYQKEIVPKLEQDLGVTNINQVPRLEKIVVNMGVGAAAQDAKQLDAAMNDLRTITGQQPCVCRARKSIAGFNYSEKCRCDRKRPNRSHHRLAQGQKSLTAKCRRTI